MRRFKSPGQAQRFLSAHGVINNLFRVGPHRLRSFNQVTLGNVTLNLGLRADRYDAFGKITAAQAEPRAGISYLLHGTNTVLRAGYAHTMETPYNENLLVATDPAAAFLISAFSSQGEAALKPGSRDQFNAGLQQALSRFVQLRATIFGSTPIPHSISATS
jgi:outer membrane receptor protein involved in Fe transport